MLTDLSFLNIGKAWPPADEAVRLANYETNKNLYSNNHPAVFMENWVRLKREENDTSIEIEFNWFKRLSNLWSSLMIGEPPKVSAGDPESAEQDYVNKLIERCNLWNTAHESLIDESRYGNGAFKVTKPSNGPAVIKAQPPNIWFPVISPDDVKEVTAHVLAWKYSEGAEPNRKDYLKAEVHYKDRIETTIYSVNEGVIQGIAEGPNVVVNPTGDFLIIPFSNGSTSDDIYGTSDYDDIQSIICELEVRSAQSSRILDKHADPSMYGPNIVEVDPITGRREIKGGSKYIPIDVGDAVPGYLVWNGQLEAQKNHMDFLMSQFFMLSETTAAAFGELKSGLAESGSALKRLLLSPLAKVNRVRLQFAPALKKAIILAAALDGVKLTSLNIQFQDGIPRDENEETDIVTKQKSAGLMSTETAVQRLQNKEGQALTDELDGITNDREAEAPPVIGGFGG
jgi:hypothetical protein